MRTTEDGAETLWPRTDPAVIMLVHDGVDGPDGCCLLGCNAQWPAAGGIRRYSTLAGFVEPGESAEMAVAREVLEEVGVVVGDVSVRGSQPWPFPGSLMLGFHATAQVGAPIGVDTEEILEGALVHPRGDRRCTATATREPSACRSPRRSRTT